MIPNEASIQKAIIEYMAAVIPSALVWAVPNAAVRRKDGKAGNAVPGLRKGVYDLSILFADGQFAAIEVKRSGIGHLSEAQIEFAAQLMFRGVPSCVARSVDDVRLFLSSIGRKTKEAKK